LANLLLITDAGDGEVATATDEDCQVIYRGSPSLGKPVFRSGLSLFASFGVEYTNFPVDTFVFPTIAAGGVSAPSGLVNETDDWIDMP